MIKLKIIDICNYDYILEDNKNKRYNINIEFYGLEKMPDINDYLYLSDKILNEKNIYSFGPLNGIYGKTTNIDEEDIIKIISNNEEFYLQRYYG